MIVYRKVSDGVGVDGVGAKFAFLACFLHFSPWPKIEGPSPATACKCAENTKFSSSKEKRRKTRKTKKKPKQRRKTKKTQNNEKHGKNEKS